MRFSISLLVTLILSLSVGLILLASFTEIFSKADILKENILIKVARSDDYERQQATNMFSNLVKAYKDCLNGEDCLCDVYPLPFTGGYTLNIDEDQQKTTITLTDTEGDVLRSEDLEGITTGVLKNSKQSCSPLKNINLRADNEGFFAESFKEKYYFFPSIQEIYKPSKNDACLLTKRLSIYSNLSEDQIKKYFSQIPPCSFKDIKIEEKAKKVFDDFTQQYFGCKKSLSTQECACTISLQDLPPNYFIRVVAAQDLKIQLVISREENFVPTNTSIRAEKTFDLAQPFYLEPPLNYLALAKEGCFSIMNGTFNFFEDCKLGIPSLSSPINLSKIYFFGGGIKFAFVKDSFAFLMPDKKSKTNLINVQTCPVASGENYSHSWPAESADKNYYLTSCFGTTETRQCNKGISIKQEEGSKIFAVESGEITEMSDAERKIVIDQDKFRLEYGNALPSSNLAIGSRVEKGQQIGILAPRRGLKEQDLAISLIDKSLPQNVPQEKVCFGKEDKQKVVVVKEGTNNYVNPVCYFPKDIRDKIIFPPDCTISNKDCSLYGNKEDFLEEINLRVLAIPVNWESSESYFEFANKALDSFLKAAPLNKCPLRFKKLFADEKTNYGSNWTSGVCFIPTAKPNCYKDALKYLKNCADQYKAVTGQDYDFVVGIDDSNIASQPACNYNERGWTSSGAAAIIVEQKYVGDVVHELGHKFGLRDQYCDCSDTGFSAICGFQANPNPLSEKLGCSPENCCAPEAEEGYPYVKGCRWCKGNYDMNSEDVNSDGSLDKGGKTSMSNYLSLNSFSIEEYNYLASQPQLQCL
ncbi:hypothetical protein HY643_00510 [Candidatus Woesearchaeota archaeon]|nr:hypothetical protein [Candidatus Woesearchaeota archaeon]